MNEYYIPGEVTLNSILTVTHKTVHNRISLIHSLSSHNHTRVTHTHTHTRVTHSAARSQCAAPPQKQALRAALSLS